ncbi:hypothetical protein [Malonomonas rubra]|uniref:hypothetical protein n=1 Tax=Malonomonas rubra TaxID=57040 RepID=UPI0026F05E03|nr:hypothetical protein [Malonomonas rubra]
MDKSAEYSKSDEESQRHVFDEIQLILAEKRTALSALRTGIAVFALPLSVMSVLVATSKFYEITQVLHLLVPLFIICTSLIVLGFYLIIHSVLRIHRYDRLVGKIKQKHSAIAKYVD